MLSFLKPMLSPLCRSCWLVVVFVFCVGCGADPGGETELEQSDGVDSAVNGSPPVTQDLLEVEDRDYRLNREWVASVWAENETTLDSIERRYEELVTEVENLQASEAGDSLVDLRARLRQLLEKEQAELDKLARLTKEMREILKEE